MRREIAMCTCGHAKGDHSLELLTMEEPHEFGAYRARLLTYKARHTFCARCHCQAYQEAQEVDACATCDASDTHSG